jgi:hypothetical protein
VPVIKPAQRPKYNSTNIIIIIIIKSLLGLTVKPQINLGHAVELHASDDLSPLVSETM